MLPRKLRYNLKERFSPERTQASEHFVIKTRHNKLQFSRFAIVISKNVEKTAVNRNRSKRSIYELISKDISLFKPNYDILIIIKKSIIGIFIEKELHDSFEKLEVNG